MEEKEEIKADINKGLNLLKNYKIDDFTKVWLFLLRICQWIKL